tara:strand:+ start:6831 stop:8669 length:1839 start_codon:yes stop_codon:yes gene_type:complete
MCGIIGILSKKNINIFEYILDSLVQLQNRGYDSSGICLIENNEFIIHKYASTIETDCIDKLKNNNLLYNNANISIGHNRWATHGPKNDINAHPHISNNKNIVIVHNGIIENYKKLKEFLVNKNFKFYSDTDTEVIANLLEFNSLNNNNFKEVIKKTIDNLNGTYGLLILNKAENNKIYCVRNGSPLLLGYNEEYAMITSEQSGFCNKLNSYISLQNDDICYVELIDNEIKINYNCTYNLNNVNLINFDETPEPYEHWTIKEIYEQPQKIMNSINNGGRILNKKLVKLGGCNDNIDVLKNIDNIILLGCGTSYHSCMYGKYFMKKLCNFNLIQIHDGADFELDDVPKKGNSLMIFISQSGETKDLHRCIEIAKNNNIFTLGIINVVDSLIAREVDCGIYCNAGREMGVASTKAFTTQVVCLSLLSCWFSQIHDINEHVRIQVIKDLKNLSIDFQNCLNIVHNQINNVLHILDNSNNLFILGKNTDESIAREGSLKIKEISYIHSEAYSSSSLKHGPFALLDENMPVILLNNNYLYETKVINAYEEVLSRKSPVIFITNNKSIKYPNTIYIPNNKSFSSLLGIIPLQLIAYYSSIKRNINPDKPKNLAKVVTVE